MGQQRAGYNLQELQQTDVKTNSGVNTEQKFLRSEE